MQDWIEVYKEITTIIAAEIPEIKYQDMWYGQTDPQEEDQEYPYPSPAVFIEFISDNIDDIGGLVQDINARINIYLVIETFADSFKGSANQSNALAFFPLLTKIHKTFHGRSGVNFSSPSRKRIAPVRTGGAILNYVQGYDSIIRDYSAAKVYETGTVTTTPVLEGTKPSTQDLEINRIYEAETN